MKSDKRASFACESCHGRKVRCVPEGDTCKSCRVHRKECTFIEAERRKSYRANKERDLWTLRKADVLLTATGGRQIKKGRALLLPEELKEAMLSLLTDVLGRRAGELSAEECGKLREYLLSPACSLSRIRRHLLDLMSPADAAGFRLTVAVVLAFKCFEAAQDQIGAGKYPGAIHEAILHYEEAVGKLPVLGPQALTKCLIS